MLNGDFNMYCPVCGKKLKLVMETQYVIEDLAEIPVRVELASEFRYRKMPLNKNALAIVISQ